MAVMLFSMVDDWKKVSVEFVQRKKNGMVALNEMSQEGKTLVTHIW